MRRRPSRLTVLAAAAVAVVVSACGSGEAATPDGSPATIGGVGELPGDLPAPPTGPPTTEPPGTAPTEPDGGAPAPTEPDGGASAPTEPPGGAPTGRRPSAGGPDGGVRGEERLMPPIGRAVEGNRVLVIGDSILAAISDRFGGQLCDRLVPRGWQVEVDAEGGQRIGFGEVVLDRRLAAGWDAAVVMLGNNYDEDPFEYGLRLDALLDRLRPRPVVLVTVTEFREDRAEVNYVLQAEARQRDHVIVVDWAARTRDDPGLTGDDGLHLSEAGRDALAGAIATVLGRGPGGSAGECLPTEFTNDLPGSVARRTG